MRIAVDAMGGDAGVSVTVAGVADFLRRYPGEAEIVLVGDRERIARELDRAGDWKYPPEIEHASEEIAMREKAAAASRRKRDSSIGRGVLLQKEGKADAFVSAGNTGAVVATALLNLGRLPGVRRPAIATHLPNEKNGFVLLDIGATTECKPADLVQFAQMGAVFAERILGRENPRVGLLNIGEEEGKGNDLVKEAHSLLGRSRLPFAGNVEPVGMFRGEVDVAVCDGFVGNLLLKFAEGLMEYVFHSFREDVSGGVASRAGALLLKPAFHRLKERLSYEEYGGAPLLGVDGICMISHGRSSPRALSNAIRSAGRFVRVDLNGEIRKKLQTCEEVPVE